MGARFVRLGIAGFKSFADATTLEILPGLTGIVGPNGCGKSNVAEALRWAMGEANARQLRGGEMDDVIFAGTSHRSSRNLAEVTLTIESDGQTPPPIESAPASPLAAHGEFQVIRRIERGGGSRYSINGREVRARDVQTLFADLASGARSSAMVSQGRVSALVNARPEERRAVLEEAAGITGLHARRAEAETRLRATEANLERAEERRAMLHQQLENLRAQAKQAMRYRSVATGALEAEATLLTLQGAKAQAACRSAEAGRTDAQEALSRAMIAAGQADTEADRAQAALPGAREDEAEARAAADQARVARESVAADAARAAAALETARRRLAQMVADQAHAQRALEDAKGADERLTAEEERLRREALEYPDKLQAAADEARCASAALEQADQAAADAASCAAEAAARASALRTLLAQAGDRARRAAEAAARLSRDREQAAGQIVEQAQIQTATEHLAQADRTLAACRSTMETAEAVRARAVASARAARETYSRSDAERQKLAATIAGLTEVLSVKDGERWPPLIDRLSVPPGLETALGAVLGDELAAAADPAAARHWRHLPALDPRPLPGRSLGEYVSGPDLLDRALAGIGVIDDERAGDAAQAALGPGQALVSPSGAVWRWNGYTVRAGTPNAASVRLHQRNRLAALQSDFAHAERAAAGDRAGRDAADHAERDAVAADQAGRTQYRNAGVAAEHARTALQSLRTRSEAANARLSALDEHLAQLQPELMAAAEAHAGTEADAAALPDTAALNQAADAARAHVALARSRDAAASRSVDALERAEQSRTHRLTTICREREDRQIRADDLTARLVELDARIAEAGSEHDHLAAEPGRAATQAAAADDALAVATARHRAASSAREAAEQAAGSAMASQRMAEHATFAARENLVRAEATLEAATRSGTEIQARILERQDALPTVPSPSDLTAGTEDRARARLQRLLRERDEIGPVNLRAEIEAETIAADVATIVRESDELGAAIAKLRGSIGSLNHEGRERLTAIFQTVDRHFQALFGRMFGGGRAHLALVGSDDPLEAGVEIFAQPPGKKLTALSLLSGGEQALTALSLIFAVFRCNPAPLCVLDEVDAPLDDANVDRFCALLTDIVHETGTRFLVVTHHQVTMARMDRLYGVTMQERGVSRLLSVDLSEAVGLVEAIAAE